MKELHSIIYFVLRHAELYRQSVSVVSFSSGKMIQKILLKKTDKFCGRCIEVEITEKNKGDPN